MFDDLQKMSARPEPFQHYTADTLWTDPYISGQMLKFHLNPDVEMSSRSAEFIARSVDWIISRFDLKAGKAVADFGCGPGLYTTPLAKTGASITGIDFSQTSIDHAQGLAREAGLEIDYYCQNYLDFTTDQRFDLIIMIFCDFCALSPDQRSALLAKWRELLAPGGAVLFDVFSPRLFETTDEKQTYEYSEADGFWAPGPFYAFCNTFKYQTEGLLLDKWTIVEPDRQRVVYNWLQCFSLDDLTQELAQNGFAPGEHFASVAGDTPSGDSREIAVIAQKI